MAASVLTGVYPATEACIQLDQTYATIAVGNDVSGVVAQDFPGGALGQTVIDNYGGQWVLVKAAENITRYSLCHVTNASLVAGTYLAEMTEAADIATGPKVIGLCLNTIVAATNPYFWLWRGPGGGLNTGIKVRSENATAGALLTPLSGTAGAVDDANVDEGVIAGLQTLTTTTTITAVEVVATTIIACNLTEVD